MFNLFYKKPLKLTLSSEYLPKDVHSVIFTFYRPFTAKQITCAFNAFRAFIHPNEQAIILPENLYIEISKKEPKDEGKKESCFEFTDKV